MKNKLIYAFIGAGFLLAGIEFTFYRESVSNGDLLAAGIVFLVQGLGLTLGVWKRRDSK